MEFGRPIKFLLKCSVSPLTSVNSILRDLVLTIMSMRYDKNLPRTHDNCATDCEFLE